MSLPASPIPQYKPAEDKIPGVAQIKDDRDLETETLLISFRFYKDKICELEKLNKSAVTKKALRCLKNAGLSTRRDLPKLGFNMQSVANEGEYKELFYGLSPDVEMKHEKIGEYERLFYFIDSKYLHVVAFKNKHYRDK
ncbi:hypothetical protein A2382_04375 [Candidatus Woesebacteria bacterium RIFOXYB1_FULL_38_16]|uniref:Uncharacterized protein n=1 Tax=Candidatus Woesebacteria bacterium RIFOXYB1_FULL_38_16 TaxID=1802538 RepID=A0A1F8CW83_9BACT|nr:MAG: hypothetical protein A2191_04450 [Candidatus Woesebacteria bacterium RIFOXYA1_FULL_38_9]OGM79805.1 MAG: hypothetical protein A2382_04375 [Candidatus Woesebacteria bacterium RIFOXYB1_FULL_38_16]